MSKEPKKSYWLPELCKNGMGKVLGVEDWSSRAACSCEQGNPVLDWVGDYVVSLVGCEGVQVDEQLVSLGKMLQHEVKLLDNCHPMVARKLFVTLADEVIENVIGTLDCHFHLAFLPLRIRLDWPG